VWQSRRRDPSPELLELLALVRILSTFVMGMDARLDWIIELLEGRW